SHRPDRRHRPPGCAGCTHWRRPRTPMPEQTKLLRVSFSLTWNSPQPSALYTHLQVPNVNNHARRQANWPFTTVATGPPRKVRPWYGELRLRDKDWLTS